MTNEQAKEYIMNNMVEFGKKVEDYLLNYGTSEIDMFKEPSKFVEMINKFYEDTFK